MTANEEQIDYWNAKAGENWARFQELLDLQMAPLGRAGIDALGAVAGQRVIDIGCGCGDTSFALADRVGPKGAVLGIDISRPMLDVANRRAAAGGFPVEFRDADAQIAELGAGAWDGAFSRFGVMFFADPVAAFANIRDALRSGGRIAFVCWRSLAENDWMRIPIEATRHLFPPMPPSDPLAPGPFAFQDSERVRGILQEAGYSAIEIAPYNARVGGLSLEDTTRLSLRMGPLGFALRMNPDLVGTVEPVLREALARRVEGGAILFDAGVWIVTATR